MTLTFCRELSAADWIAHSDLPWSQLVGFGPAGFDAYARLRILPDPARPGQSENDVEVEDWRHDQLTRLFEVLATHTVTPEDCYFCVWDGYGVTNIALDDGAVDIDDEDVVAQLGRAGAQPGVATPACCPQVDVERAEGRGAQPCLLALPRAAGRRRHLGQCSKLAGPVPAQ